MNTPPAPIIVWINHDRYEAVLSRAGILISTPAEQLYTIARDKTGRIRCTCPHWQYRLLEHPERRDCKHIRACKANGLIEDAVSHAA